MSGSPAGSSGAGGRVLGTRGRIALAFAALAVAFGAAFAVQVARLARMARSTAELRDRHEDMRLALELEDAVRIGYGLEDRAARGDGAALDAYEAAQCRIATLVAAFAARVRDPGSSQGVEGIEAAVRELDGRFRARLESGARGALTSPEEERARYDLVFLIEDRVDGLFGHLQGASAAQSKAIEGLRADAARVALLFAVAIPLFGLGIAVFLARSIARPLAVLRKGAARIASGDLDARVELRGSDEFATLGRELNAMAAALKRHEEELVRAERLAGLGRLTAGIAHEINNPLQVMLGYLTLHRDRVEEPLATHLARVEREATRCREIVEGLLELTRPGAAAPGVPVDLRALADDVAHAIRVAQPRAPEIRVSGRGAALGSASRLRQVVLNLAQNAAEAAGPEGEVDLEVSSDGEVARVVVADSGPGVPGDLRDRVFEPFFTTKAAGTGLGLALARAIARADGGDVELAAGAGRGARFAVRAPAAAQPSQGAAP